MSKTLNPRGHYRKGRARREHILLSAMRVFEGRGLGSFSVQDVADAADVAKSVVLYYFGDRDRLLDALLESVLSPLLEAQTAAIESAGSDPREQMRRWLDVHFEGEATLAASRLYVQMLAEGGAASRSRCQAHDRASNILLTDLLRQGHRQYCWKSPNPKAIAMAIRAIIDGAHLACLKLEPDDDLDRVRGLCRRAVLDLLVRV